MPDTFVCQGVFAISNIPKQFLGVESCDVVFWGLIILPSTFLRNINLLLTEHEGSTGEYWPELVVVQTIQKRQRVNIPQYGSSLLGYACFKFAAFENKKYTADDHFYGNGRYGKILTKKEPIITVGFTLPYNREGLFLENRGWRWGGGGVVIQNLLYYSVAKYVNMENIVSFGGFMLCSVFLFFVGGA